MGLRRGDEVELDIGVSLHRSGRSPGRPFAGSVPRALSPPLRKTTFNVFPLSICCVLSAIALVGWAFVDGSPGYDMGRRWAGSSRGPGRPARPSWCGRGRGRERFGIESHRGLVVHRRCSWDGGGCGLQPSGGLRRLRSSVPDRGPRCRPIRDRNQAVQRPPGTRRSATWSSTRPERAGFYVGPRPRPVGGGWRRDREASIEGRLYSPSPLRRSVASRWNARRSGNRAARGRGRSSGRRGLRGDPSDDRGSSGGRHAPGDRVEPIRLIGLPDEHRVEVRGRFSELPADHEVLRRSSRPESGSAGAPGSGAGQELEGP